ncbi:TonB-dependent receptor [Microbulbifer sp. PSTR4-B]|uniref:TonB-dependent receptor n=1 Tax=Microbulbifer sp. PSTR4-B TaxID=3243396 RepID=UPI00403A4F1B
MKKLFTIRPIAQSIGLVAGLSAGLAMAAKPMEGGLEEVVVTAQLRDTNLLDLPGSVSVIGTSSIEARGAGNLDQLLNMAPNVNFSTGASRGRFIQVRGIGERSQFIDPVNPSVGLVIDGIDFTGLGLAANTLDIEQVEILRGPQGTLYGANALAGLVNMRSAAPTSETTGKVSAELSEYGGRSLTAIGSGSLTEQLGYRIAASERKSDGYMENQYLGRDDTNNIDESVLRGKLAYSPSDDLKLGLTLFYLDADNGYDAFSLYNTRKTLSDKPGRDQQESWAGALTGQWSGNENFTLEATLSHANSDTEYGYDEDWSYIGFHPWEYSQTDNYQRDKDNTSLDLRLLSTESSKLFARRTSWVLGVYHRHEQEDLLQTSGKTEGTITEYSFFSSEFDTKNSAVYGQLSTTLTDTLNLITGLRLEKRSADYSDSYSTKADSNEDLWGGNITLEYHYSEDTLLYATVSRGYKAGGVNGAIIAEFAGNEDTYREMFEFDTEHLLNYELGAKGNWLDNRLQAQLAAFYQDRSDVQAKQSLFNPESKKFREYLGNAAGGETFGFEAEINFQATDTVRLFASAGWLNAEFVNFISSTHVDTEKDEETGTVLSPVNLDGRDVAHAPSYQFFTGTEIDLSAHWVLRLELEGKDEFYFSNSHNEKSTAYELLNARLTYRADNWEVSLWGRNLANEDYYTRGFYFSNDYGNNPANFYAPEPYYQQGEPRIAGVTGTYTF